MTEIRSRGDEEARIGGETCNQTLRALRGPYLSEHSGRFENIMCISIGRIFKRTSFTSALATIFKRNSGNRVAPAGSIYTSNGTLLSPPVPDPVIPNSKKEASDFNIDGLEVVGGLGQGGFGIVVEVETASSRAMGGGRLAMKCLPKSRLTRPNDRQSIAREIEVLATLPPCRFLLNCHFAFETSSDIFLVTDLLSGGDLFFRLDQVVGRGSVGFPEDQARTLLAEISLGLFHLHKHGFIHRDIKVENIMLDSAGHVKLVDFGLTLRIPLDEGLHAIPVQPAGSIIYMAPELLRQKIGGRFTDWWAVGILAYELFTGRSPWSSLSNMATIRAEIRTLRVLTPVEASQTAGQFIRGLLQKDHRMRLGAKSDFEVLASPFFKDVDWEAMERGETPPALTPQSGESTVAHGDSEAILGEYTKFLGAATRSETLVLSSNTGSFDMGLVRATRAPPVRSATL